MPVAEQVDGRGGLKAIVRSRGARVLIGLLVIALLTVEAVLLAPHLGGAGAALAHVNWTLVVLAIIAEAGSLVAFAAMHRQMLRGGGLRVPLRRIAAVLLAGNALSATLPAGSALASGYGFTRMRRFGASAPLAAWTVVITGLVSGATLAGLGLAAALLVGAGSKGSIAGLVAAGSALTMAIGMRVAAQHPERVSALGQRLLRGVNRLRGREHSAGGQRVRAFVAQLVVIRPRAADWLAAVGFAALNWAADVTCLVLACHAAGISDLSPRTVLVAYAADAAAGLFQLLPGGIGIVDGALILALVSGGVPTESATAGVAVYRLITLVLVAAAGWLMWFVLRSRDPAVSATAGRRG